MRVLQVIAGAEHGGAELFFGELILAIKNYQKAPISITQKAVMRPYLSRLEQLERGGVDVTALQFGSWLDWRSRYVMREEVKNFRPHIVQTWMNRATKFTPPPTVRQPYVHIGWLGGYHDMKYYQTCDHIVALTGDMKRHALDAGWTSDRVHVIPPFAMLKPNAAVTRAQFDTPDDAKVILSTARLHVRKAQDILLKSMVDVPNAYLWVAGEGDLRKPLTALAEELKIADRVRFLGWRTDHQALLRAADLFVLPSRYEPFGIVILEAWSQGCPVIAASSQGPKSIITHDHDGLLVPVDNVGELADALRNVLSDEALRKKLVQNAHRTYQSTYSQESVVRRYFDLYENVAMMGSYAKAA